MFGQLKN